MLEYLYMVLIRQAISHGLPNSYMHGAFTSLIHHIHIPYIQISSMLIAAEAWPTQIVVKPCVKRGSLVYCSHPRTCLMTFSIQQQRHC